jgi:catechol 2,3-dioxygenase-like lactoylglutathione lyase family enzyme
VIRRLDHLVLTTRDHDRCIDFYTRVLGMRSPRPMLSALLLAPALAGCASALPFVPERQPSGVTISAGIALRDDRLLVRIDSEGYRVEQAMLVRDGVPKVAPESLVPPLDPPTSGLSIGVGVGGGSARGSYSVGTGVGAGVGGPYREATTLAVFRLDQAGPPPWRLRVKVVGVEPVDIILAPAGSARR